MKIHPFTPVSSQNPVYLQGEAVYEQVISLHDGTTFAEIKEDGYRLQIHKYKDTVKAFTRSMNEVDLELFPELRKSLMNLPDCILDSEILGKKKVGKKGFDAIKKRFRPKISKKGKEEYLASDIVKEYPLDLRVFDTLYWEGEDLLGYPLIERRAYTESIAETHIIPSKQKSITEPLTLRQWFEKLVGTNYEGLVCKNPDSLYVPDSRTTDWIKLKRAETFDLVVMGVYIEDGRIGQILCGTQNNGRYETLGKVNAKREGLDALLAPLLQGDFSSPPSHYNINSQIQKHTEGIPSYYVDPTVVVEVAAMNLQYSKNWHSCGLDEGKSYSLRIGWLKQIREDKVPSQTTTTQEIIRQYQEMEK